MARIRSFIILPLVGGNLCLDIQEGFGIPALFPGAPVVPPFLGLRFVRCRGFLVLAFPRRIMCIPPVMECIASISIFVCNHMARRILDAIRHPPRRIRHS